MHKNKSIVAKMVQKYCTLRGVS